MLDRGGNVSLVIFPFDPPTAATKIEPLRASFARLGGTMESPPDGRFIVVTVPIAAGFAAIEHADRPVIKNCAPSASPTDRPSRLS